MLTDTHAHLFWETFKEDFDQVIQRAIGSGVTTIINVGVDLDSSQKAFNQIEQIEASHPNLKIFSSIGIHPHESFKYSQNPDVSIREDINRLEDIFNFNPQKVKAIGECGLDFFFKGSDFHTNTSLSINEIKDLQVKLFQAQIDLAKKLNLPLLVHCRDDRSQNPENSEAWDLVARITKDHFGIYHCYSGLPSTTHYLLQATNFLFSFAGNITYPNANILHEAVKIIPLDRIVTETDCPFLPPQEKRGMRNEPANVSEVIKMIAQVKQIPIEEVAKITTENARVVFAF